MPSSALDYITIQGFKSIASVENLALRPINVLIGPNGSGKSNFLDGFALLHEIGEGRLGSCVTEAGGAEKVLHFGSKTTKSLRYELAFANEFKRYELTLSVTADDGLFPSSEKILAWDKNHRAPEYPPGTFGCVLDPREHGREAGISDPKPGQAASQIRDHLSRWRVYHLNDTSTSSPIRKTARVDDNRFLRPDGSNLAAFLYYLRERHTVAYRLIERTIQRVAPFFQDFVLLPLNLEPDAIKLEWRHVDSDQYFDASSLSDGTLRFIVLATLFLQPEKHRPSVILVDEPELGLHPYAIDLLASLIKQASVSTQVVVSTQSSLLLDQFEPEDVLVADRADGGTEIRRLSSAQLATWLEEYSLGQLWEKNEIGGRPVRD